MVHVDASSRAQVGSLICVSSQPLEVFDKPKPET